MRTIKFANKIKKVRIDNKLEKREFFYAIIDNYEKYIGFYLEDVPLELMKKAYAVMEDKDVFDDNGDFVETIQVKVKKGQLDFFNAKGITYIKPHGRYHYLGNGMVNEFKVKSNNDKKYEVLQ